MMVMVDYDDDEPSCPQTGVKWKGQEGQTQRVGAVSPSLIVKRIIIIVNIIIIVLDREDDRYHLSFVDMLSLYLPGPGPFHIWNMGQGSHLDYD